VVDEEDEDAAAVLEARHEAHLLTSTYLVCYRPLKGAAVLWAGAQPD
jgi:hypothetical protein